MNLADEFAAGFSAGSKPLATAYTLTNDPHFGVMTATKGNAMLTEPGYVPEDGLVIVESIANFPQPPDPEAREIIDVLEGPFKGKWVLVGCVADNANFTLTCEASE